MKILSILKNRSKKESEIFKKLETIINNNSLIVAGYLSVMSEVNLSLFLNFLLKKKFSLCLPYIKKLKSSLFFKEFTQKSKLVCGKYNIKYPDTEILVTPNIILVSNYSLWVKLSPIYTHLSLSSSFLIVIIVLPLLL